MRRLTAGLILIQALFAAGAERVLVDTDSGLFGDDGSALVMLARSPGAAAMAREAERRWGKLAFTGAFAGKPAAPAAGPRTGGVEFLIAEIERFPGEVTVLAIGPMTNLAMAL